MSAENRFWIRGRKLIAAAGIAIVLIAGAIALLWFSWDTLKPLTLKNRLEAEWQSLDVTQRAIEGRTTLQQWSAGAFVGSTALDQLVQQTVGYRLEYVPTDAWLSGTTIAVKSATVKPTVGYTLANVVLVARKDGLELELGLTGSLSYLGVERVEGGNPDEIVAKFRIEPQEIAPTTRIGPLQFRLSQLWEKLVPDLVVALAKPELFEISLPLKDRLKFNLGVSVTGAKERVNKDTGATITYDATLPETTMEQWVSFSAPVFRPEGVWLLAKQSDDGQDTVRPTEPPPEAELAAAVQNLREELEQQTAAFTGDPGTLNVWIAPTLVTSLANRLSEQGDEARRLTIQTIEREGRLAEAKWRDDLMGDGGAYAELVDGRSGLAIVQFGKPTVSWEANGMRLVMPADASMQAKIHFHFDPLIGGGMGTSAGLEGKGSGTVNISTQTTVISDVSGLKVAAMDTRLSCDAVKTTVTTDGVLKIELGWINVPKVGAKIVLPLGRYQIGAIALLDNRPLFVASPSDDPRMESDAAMRAERIKKNPWALVPPTGGMKVRVVPESISTDVSGIRAVVSLGIEPMMIGHSKEDVDKARQAVEQEAMALAERAAELLKQQRPVEGCEGEAEIAILLGPIEFGPRNEIVKWAKNSWNDITKGPGPNNDLRKAVEEIGETIGNVLPTIKVGQSHGGLGVQIGGWKF